jgi:hypothetical protein
MNNYKARQHCHGTIHRAGSGADYHAPSAFHDGATYNPHATCITQSTRLNKSNIDRHCLGARHGAKYQARNACKTGVNNCDSDKHWLGTGLGATCHLTRYQVYIIIIAKNWLGARHGAKYQARTACNTGVNNCDTDKHCLGATNNLTRHQMHTVNIRKTASGHATGQNTKPGPLAILA